MLISLAGNLGSGKSTICRVLESQYGFYIHSTGTIQRRIAAKLGLTTLELNQRMKEDHSIDGIIDNEVTEISVTQSNDNIVFDSRLAWHFAKNTFKVYTIINPYIAAQRVFKDEKRGAEEKYSSADEAFDMLRLRAQTENTRFKDIYGIDNFDYNNYDLILDTTELSPEESAKIIFDKASQYFANKTSKTEIYISPSLLYPMENIIGNGFDKTLFDEAVSDLDKDTSVKISVINGFHYIVEGNYRVLASITKKIPVIKCELKPVKDGFTADVSAFSAFEKMGNFKYVGYPR